MGINLSTTEGDCVQPTGGHKPNLARAPITVYVDDCVLIHVHKTSFEICMFLNVPVDNMWKSCSASPGSMSPPEVCRPFPYHHAHSPMNLITFTEITK